MLRKSRTRAMNSLLGSAILLALPLAAGCQTGNFGGNIPGYGTIAGWWGGGDKPDPNKPPAGYQANLPSSKADPNGQSYAGASSRGARGGYGAEGGGFESSAGGYGAQGSYAAGSRNNVNNWEGSKRGGASSYGAGGADADGEFAAAPSYGKNAGYGANARGDKATPGYDPYGGATPSDEEEAAAPRGAAYTADARGTGRAGGYSTRTVSGNERASRSTVMKEEDYEAEQTAPSGGSRFSSREESAPGAGRRTYDAEPEDNGAMTADEEAEPSYPQTKGYGTGYKVPSNRAAAPSTERRYPSTKSGAASSRSTDDDYGMSETEMLDDEEPAVERVAASEPTRYGLSSKAAAMLDRDLDGDFRPGTTSRPGYRTASKVAPAGYASEETEEEFSEESAGETGRTASRFAE